MSVEKQTLLRLAAALSLLLLALLACNLGGFGISVDKGVATVDITLSQNQVNTLLANSRMTGTGDNDELLDKITRVEMHAGYMRIFGEDQRQDGSSLQGSYDVAIGAANDVLTVEITAVDMPGVTLSDPRIARANQEIAEALTKSVQESQGDVKYKEATVSEGQLKLKIQVALNTPK
jgi:hypothetical protein